MIESYAVVTDSYFDGERCFDDGPRTVIVEDGVVTAISLGDHAEALARRGVGVTRAAFLMPGLVEAHCHLFLDGGQLDFKARSEYLNAPAEEMRGVARENLAAALAAGVTLVVDAGDRYGINHEIRRESREVTVRSAGLALRRRGRYGGFMAREVETRDDIAAAVAEIGESADDVKVILTGIIDFAAGEVKGAPQFNVDELRMIVDLARGRGLRTFVHCSGVAGLEVAVEAGVDSIEHGFFMTPDLLSKMADRGIAWVPTFSPVHFQWARPEVAGWDEKTVDNLRRILDRHFEQVAIASEMGVAVIAGSDAGSHGVRHGEALIDELFFLRGAGVPMAAVLSAATSLPRRRWGVSEGLSVGSAADFIALAGSPFEKESHLLEVEGAFGARPAESSVDEVRKSAAG